MRPARIHGSALRVGRVGRRAAGGQARAFLARQDQAMLVQGSVARIPGGDESRSSAGHRCEERARGGGRSRLGGDRGTRI